MDDPEEHLDQNVTIPVQAVRRPGAQRRLGYVAAITMAVLVVAAIGARLTASPAVSPTPSAAPSVALATATLQPTPTSTAAFATPVALVVDQPIHAGSGTFQIEAVNSGSADEVAGVIQATGSSEPRGFILDLATRLTTVIPAPAGFNVDSVGGLSDTAAAGTLVPLDGKSPGVAAFVYDRATGAIRIVESVDGFDELYVDGIVGGLAYGEMDRLEACCAAPGSYFAAESRAITIDLASGVVTDLTPPSWRGETLAVRVAAADGDRLLLSASTAPSPDAGVSPVLRGAAVMALDTGATTEVTVGTDFQAVLALTGDYILGTQWMPQPRSFVLGIGTTSVVTIPLGANATFNFCGHAIARVSAFACMEGNDNGYSDAFLYVPAQGARTEIPVAVPTGQGVTLTAGSPDGIIAGAVSGPFQPVKPFAYDAATGALYGLIADSQMQSGPEMITGRWVLSSDGAHAWLLP